MADHEQEASSGETALTELIEQLDLRGDFGLHNVDYSSGVRGGEVVHRSIGRITGRQSASVLEQLQRWSDAVNQLMKLLAPLAGRVAELEEALRDITDRQEFRPWYSNDAFEAAFRGTREQMLARYEDLADRLVGCGPVLDIGCGRGELLELLGARGVEAWGVDLDAALVETAAAAGLDVRHGDGLAALRDAGAGALGGVALIQVIEHITSQQAVDLVALAADRVRPGGRVVIETVNPQSLYVYAHAFYLDPTHVRPVHPAWLTFLFQQAGFSEVAVDWRTPPPDEDVLQPVGDASHDANVERLNRLLFGAQDYAVIATR
jgi:O-antigen chain-terminating methyltransferase